jgi:hypothetical protein
LTPRPFHKAFTPFPIHPVLLAAALVIGFWLDTTVSPFAATRSLLIGVVGAALATAVAWANSRNRHIAGVAVTGLIVGVYAKRLEYLVQDLAGRMPAWALVLWVVLVLLVALLAFRLTRRHLRAWSWPVATRRLNVGALLLLIATVGSGLLTGRLMGAINADRTGAVEVPPSSGGGSAGNPDIYVVLLDGYPRADVLQHAFEYDNSPFVSGLEERGFTVATRSHSDYLWTHVSLSSLLQMDYIENIDSLEPVVAGKAPLHPAIRRTVNRNPAFEFLRDRGYRVISIASGFEELALRGADVYVDDGAINEFELKLLSSTFLGNVVATVAPDFASGSHRHRILDEFATLGDLAGRAHAQPQLVFTHIPVPHQPMVFGKDGAPRVVPLNEDFYSDSPVQQGISSDEWVVDYRDQLAYLNQLILGAVDDIIAASPEPPIIVLWADHGSASRVDWVRTQPKEADPADLLERTGTLFASLTPGRDSVFPDDITPVNVFRYLFDSYFGTALGAADPPVGGGQIAPVDAMVFAP